ncbi:hypothetical protein DFH11DRAFT_1789599 [Phellopilus nigrolimitatus]|nr:hypothetical protein DFH11DRAFT_1789599 [Phellopilus nigrolimitatus]
MRFFWSSRSRSRSDPSDGMPALPRTLPLFTSEKRNTLAATCRDLSAYYERQANLDSFSSPEPSTKSPSCSSVSPISWNSQLTDSPRSIARSPGRVDSERIMQTSHVQSPFSRGGSSPSLHRFNKRIGDAPASPLSEWDTFDVNSVDTAVNLLQGVASYHDVDRFVQVVRVWLKSLPRLNNLDAAAHIRSAAINHFLRVWHPSYKETLTFSGDASLDVRFAVARLLGMLLRAKVVDCTDIAFAAEFLFAHRQHEGYMRGLYELISTAGDKAAQPASLERMMALVEGLENAKKVHGCHGVAEYADVHFQIHLVLNGSLIASSPAGHRQHHPLLRRRSGGLELLLETEVDLDKHKKCAFNMREANVAARRTYLLHRYDPDERDPGWSSK